MSNREMEERHLAQADRHIAEAEANIVRFKKLMLLIEDSGRDTSIQTKLLATMLMTLALFNDHRNLILEALSR